MLPLPDPWFSDLRTRLCSFEGRIPYLYLDTVGNVTCGVGHLLRLRSDVLLLHWVKGKDPAGDWSRVKEAPPGMTARCYQELSTCRLGENEMDDLLDSDIAEKGLELRARLSTAEIWPPPVRAAIYDMAFNLGTAGLISKFPRMIAAMRIGDWVQAAKESRRNGISDARNDYTASLILSARSTVAPVNIFPVAS